MVNIVDDKTLKKLESGDVIGIEAAEGIVVYFNIIDDETLKKLESGDVIGIEAAEGIVVYLATEKWAEKMEKVGGLNK